MKRVTSTEELRRHRASWSGTVVLVPTMGALHAGHIALMEKARSVAGSDGTVVVSIFVNPIQFDRASDLQNYPQPIERDLELCQSHEVDCVFTPEISTLYHEDRSVLVTEDELTKRLCGATRPGHFDGVLTVVLKLFNLTQPTHAVFGKKDYQQLAVIRRMVRDLDVPVEILGEETVREEDGLALSSRNRRLTAEQRKDAPRIRKALLAAEARSEGGQIAQRILEIAAKSLETGAREDFVIDYLELLDASSLAPIERLTQPSVLATACFYDQVRLIDNIVIDPRTNA